MKFKLPKLHNQILIALILGALFGSIFNVSKSSLILTHRTTEGFTQKTINDWDSFTFITKSDTLEFEEKSQTEILSYQKTIEQTEYDVIIKKNNQIETISHVISIKKEETIATSIKWIGDIFIRLLTMIAVPLVLASLTVGAASLGDIKKFARIGGKTIAFYLVTTAIAVTIGLAAANLIQPGRQMNEATKERLMAAYTNDVSSKIGTTLDYNIFDELVKMVPRNPFGSMANGEMLQVVLFSILLGLVLSMINKEKSAPVINFFDGLSEAMIKMVDIIMWIAPFGVFALIAATVSEFGFEILQTLIWYAFAVLLGLLIQTTVVYSLIVKIFSKIKVYTFFKGIRRAQTIAFSTSSSAATLPVTMECCNENLGVSKSITSFVLPLGATINMDGTALYQGVAAVFIAQVFGMDLTFVQQLTIVLTATLASIGTAPVPGVGIIMLIIVLKSVGIPQEGIALILGIDRILDMCRTITNITGDSAISVAVASSEKEILQPDLQNA